MNPSRNLETVKEKALHRITKLRRLADRAVNDSDKKRRDYTFSYVMIETVNLWSLFIRSFYLSCTQSTKHPTGAKVTCKPYGTKTTANAINVAMVYFKRKPSGREPAWHDRHTISKLAKHLGFSNESDIDNALSLAPKSLGDLVIIRNFYAHRNQETYSNVRNVAISYGLIGIDHPNELLQGIATGRPQQVILDLLDDLRNTIELMCQ